MLGRCPFSPSSAKPNSTGAKEQSTNLEVFIPEVCKFPHSLSAPKLHRAERHARELHVIPFRSDLKDLPGILFGLVPHRVQAGFDTLLNAISRAEVEEGAKLLEGELNRRSRHVGVGSGDGKERADDG
jgi:hypothetical protein